MVVKTLWIGLMGTLVLGAQSHLEVQGKVTDQSGLAIPNAWIQLSAPGLSEMRTQSDREGRFHFAISKQIAEGIKIQADAQGFEILSREFQPGTSNRLEVEFVLSVAQSSHTVTVWDQLDRRVLETDSATRTKTPLINVPQAISVVSVEQMRDQAMMSMADVVRYTPGITMAQGEGHRDAPVIRGNATTSDFFVNGVRDDVQYYRDLYNLERVEALKGPNALAFGRGGGGGVLNRVTKEARFSPLREFTFTGGSFGNKRVAADLEQPLSRSVSFRLNSMFEDSNTFRRYGNLNRYGVSPTLSWLVNERTKVRFGYEFFHDGRIVDRGVPSFEGRAINVDRRIFFGNPDVSRANADVHLGNVVVERQLGSWNLKNQTLFGAYDKYYGNVLPGGVNADATLVTLTGYSNATQRNNLFNQTDLVRNFNTGRLKHTLLSGLELGRQSTDNFRRTAFFDGTSTSLLAPVSNPTVFSPVQFLQNPSDANNHVGNQVAATYFQDQIAVSRHLQLVAGLRVDHFDLKYRNNRGAERLGRVDNMVSPRLGIVLKPVDTISVYGSYSVSYLPSAGDQFSSLTATTQTLKPEKFNNYEGGVKWDLRRGLTLTTALYRLDRKNTTAPSPDNPALIVQTGSQRSNGVETSLNGRVNRIWSVAGGWSWQDAYISSTTRSAAAGARVPMVPRNSVSLWNNVRITGRLSGGLGWIQQGSMYASIDNRVRIEGFARADAALFYQLSERMRLQANVENLTDRKYIVNAHNNNNLMPGTARALRITLTTRF